MEAGEGRRIAAALRALGVEGQAIPLGGKDRADPSRRSFAIDSPIGGRLKVRVAYRERVAVRAARLAESLEDEAIAAPLARVGRFVLEPWIDGMVLTGAPLAPRQLADAGALLARVHGFAGTEGEHLPRRHRVDRLRSRAQQHLLVLCDADVISRGLRSGAQKLLDRLPPASPWGLGHGDFCGENLVMRPDGLICSIDNERLGRAFLAYDFARMRYRWPLAESDYRTLVAGYVRAGGVFVGDEEMAAWCAAAALKGAELRIRRGGSPNRGLELLDELVSAS